jgi:hypothetical protein
MNQDSKYALLMDTNLSINELRHRFAVRLTKKLELLLYNHEDFQFVGYKFQDVEGRPGDADLVVYHKRVPTAQNILEFYGPQRHLQFYIRDSARNMVTTDEVKIAIDSMPDIARKSEI